MAQAKTNADADFGAEKKSPIRDGIRHVGRPAHGVSVARKIGGERRRVQNAFRARRVEGGVHLRRARRRGAFAQSRGGRVGGEKSVAMAAVKDINAVYPGVCQGRMLSGGDEKAISDCYRRVGAAPARNRGERGAHRRADCAVPKDWHCCGCALCADRPGAAGLKTHPGDAALKRCAAGQNSKKTEEADDSDLR